MKRYLGTVPLQWPNSPIGSSLTDVPTPPELTFEESFFVNLPESYEPWSVEEDPADGSNRGDNDDNDGDVRFTLPDDDPAENEE